MADMNKAERLAAARRKLQDFQRKKESHPPPSSIPAAATNELQTNHGQFSSEQISQISSGDSSVPKAHIANPAPDSQFPQSTPEFIPQYGSGEVTYGIGNAVATNGLRPSYNMAEELQSNPHLFTPPQSASNEASGVFQGSSYFSSAGSETFEPFAASSSNHITTQSYFTPTPDVGINSTAHLFAQNDEKMMKWDLNSLTTPSSSDLVNYAEQEAFVVEGSQVLTSNGEKSQELPPSLQSSFTETSREQQDHNFSNSSLMQESKPPEMPANGSFGTESIRQLSDQITQLIDPSVLEDKKQNSSFVSSLETRNQELAAQLAAERLNNQQLQFNLKESQSQVSHLQLKVDELQSQQEVILARHLGPLQEQLRAHAQTVGILVGEKTELEAAINHHTATAKQHASEVEELQNRLRASRHRVSELEKELASVTSAASSADKQNSNRTQELDQLRLQNGMLSKQLEDAEEEASELRQKLSARVSEVGMLTAQLQEKQSQLSLSQLRVTQLSSSDNPEASAEIESLHQLKISLEKRCTELTETVRQLSADRDQADQQYQQYVAQLNGQLLTANSKLESVCIENEKLKNREEDLVRNMSELERQLQQQIHLHQQQQNQPQQQSYQQTEETSDSQSTLIKKVSDLEEESQRLQSLLDLETQKLGNLQAELEEKDTRIADLQTLCNERPDQSRLLAAMESDKVAAAQATSQNTVLKQQLQELQDGFIKMSNDKLNLTESLEHEKHVNKEMGEKISQLAEELHELRVLVSEKERRLQEYREREPEQNHDHHNCSENGHDHEHSHDDDNNSNENTLHIHEKQHAHVANTLQEQLSQAHEHIHNLSSQNNNLRRLIAQKSTESHESGSSSSATEGATTDDAAADQDTNCEDAPDGHANYSCMQYAMEKLQERFTRTMAEVAELSDEKQRLEHLVLQLQGETETIGEYVALYQMQRAALQQKAREKDHQLASLSAEREDLRRKLYELNQLVQRLLDSRGTETAKEAFSVFEAPNDNATNSDVIEVPNVVEAVGQESNVNDDVAKRLSKQILSIIDDIGVGNDTEASFHPCPWCSGRLKNV